MDLKSLEALGITADVLTDRIVDKAVERLLSSNNFDEDGEEYVVPSGLKQRLDKAVKVQIDGKIAALAEQHVLPRVSEMIENLTLQATNNWGEKTGAPVTFIEYLTQRADAYMQEPVNHNGKTKTEDSYSWSKSTSRVAYLINSHLHYSIETAMKNALANANSSIAKGLEDAVKTALQSATAKLNVTVKT